MFSFIWLPWRKMRKSMEKRYVSHKVLPAATSTDCSGFNNSNTAVLPDRASGFCNLQSTWTRGCLRIGPHVQCHENLWRCESATQRWRQAIAARQGISTSAAVPLGAPVFHMGSTFSGTSDGAKVSSLTVAITNCLKRNLFSTKACTATIWPAAIGSADLFCALENYNEMVASFASNAERGCACKEWKGKLIKPFELHMSPTVLDRIGPLCFSRSRLSSARRSSSFLLGRSGVQLQEVSMKSGTRQGARTERTNHLRIKCNKRNDASMTFRCWFKSFHMWHVSLECKIKRVAVHLMMFMINLTCRRVDCMCACLEEDLREASHVKRWRYSPLVQTTAFNEHMLAWTPLQGFLSLPTQWHATWSHVLQQDMFDILIFISSLLWKQMKQLHRERVFPKATGLTTVIFPEVWAPKNQTAFVITTLNPMHLQRSFFVTRASAPLESKLLLAKDRHSRLNQFLLLSVGQIYGTATEAGHHTWGKRRTRRSGWMNSRAITSAQHINTNVTSCAWTKSKHVNSRATTSAQRINNYVTSCTSSANISTHVPPQVHSVSIPMSLHVHEWTMKQTYQLTYHHKCTAYQYLCHFMYMNQKQTYQLTYHHKCTAYQYLCHFMYMNEPRSKHINSHTTTSAQRINTYVTSCTWTKSKHINSRTTTIAQRINTYVTSMEMNHEERTIKNGINPLRTPPTNTHCINTYVTSMKINHHGGPGRTSPCHKNKMKHFFM